MGRPPSAGAASLRRHDENHEGELEVEEVVGGDYQEEREGGDGDFADGAHGEGAEALFAHFAEIGAEADAGEGEEEGPAGKIREGEILVLGEEVVGGKNGDEEKAQDEFGEFLPEEGGFVADSFGLALAGPIDGVGKNDEADHGVAGGLGEDGEFAGSVGIESAGGGGFGGVVHGEAGPEAVGLVGEMERVADEREGEEGEGAESENGGDGEGGVFIVGVNGAFGGDDGADTADGGADGEERGELGAEIEEAAEKGHESEGAEDLDARRG